MDSNNRNKFKILSGKNTEIYDDKSDFYVDRMGDQ